MLGYKFINIKIQTALIKQIMYSYLFNLFLVSPNRFFKFILTNFSKDTIDFNSKEQFEKFVKSNESAFNSFFSKQSNKVRKYMLLTAILDKDMKTNFNDLSDVEIEELGLDRLKTIFFNVFFDLTNKVKDEFNIEIEDLYKEANYKESLEDLFNISIMTPTSYSLSDSTLVGVQKYALGYTKKQAEDLSADIIVNNSTGQVFGFDYLFSPSKELHGEFYYKIKENLEVELDCGSSTRKNIIISSIRNSNNQNENEEFLGVQEFYNWKNDKSYERLEQFLFIRLPEIKQNIIFGSKTTGLIEVLDLSKKVFNYKTSFDSNSYVGAKILNQTEILDLKNKLELTNNNSGFLAIIPTNTISEEKVKKINEFLSNLDNFKKLFLCGFSKEERNLKMSAADVIKSLNGLTIRNGQYNVGFDINELFDAYFSILETTYSLQPSSDVINVIVDSYDEKFAAITNLKGYKKINTSKEGEYLIYSKFIDDVQTGKLPELKKTNIVFTKYFTVNRKYILNIKLSAPGDDKFGGLFQVETIINQWNGYENVESISYSLGLSTSIYLKSKYYDKIMNILQKDEFVDINKLMFPSELLSDSVIEKLNFGIFKNDISSIPKSFRSYKNYDDFLKYYIDIVEALAKESADRV